MLSKRWMALWLPRLSSDRISRSGQAAPDERPLIVYARQGNSHRVTGLDRRASQIGLRVGMPLADARAIRPDVRAIEADEEADRALLDQIAAWCDRYSPIVVPDPPQGLLIDTTGASHLFGGEARMIADIEERLARQGIIARAAIAPTPGGAWALSRAGKARIVEEDDLRETLAPLPIAALRLAPDRVALLKRLGLHTIGQLIDRPRKPFAARAGEQAMLRLDQALGQAPEALSPRHPPPDRFSLRALVEPVLSLEAVMIVAQALTDELCGQLAENGLGACRFRLCLFGVDNRVRHVTVGLSRPESQSPVLLRLIRERLGVTPEALDAEFGFDLVRLEAYEVRPVVLRMIDLAPKAGRDREAEARLIDRLTIRLGATRIGQPAVRMVHAPERANQWGRPAPVAANQPGTVEDGVMRRPIRLFRQGQPVDVVALMPDGPPRRFTWRHVLHDIIRAEGPERITPDWLRAPDARARDYYRVEDREGRRFWLYSEGPLDGRPPRWYLQGLFA